MSVLELGQRAQAAAGILAQSTTAQKNSALKLMAKAIRHQALAILEANQKDLAACQKATPAFIDRLTLDPARIEAMATGLEAIADLPDPVGRVLAELNPANTLRIEKIAVPIGVIAVIFEARPNVTADAAGLTLKSGNAVILRGGSDSFHSATAIVKALHFALDATQIPLDAIQILSTPQRSAVDELLKLDHYIDVLIPRGGPKLIQYVSENTKIPVFKHLAGLCHTYLHSAADLEKAQKIILNAKMRRTGICGATEVLLVDQDLAPKIGPIVNALLEARCELRGESPLTQLYPQIKPASAKDYDTEFLAPILALKLVEDVDAAMLHIAQHGTHHTDAILTEDQNVADHFLKAVDSAIVIHNASTQFADGGEFGMGAEMGIATGKLHARGPVGVEQLTTFKYLIHGHGQIRS